MIKKVTTISPRELEEISRIWLEANITTHDFIPANYWQANYQKVKELLPTATLYLAYQEAEIIGFFRLG